MTLQQMLSANQGYVWALLAGVWFAVALWASLRGLAMQARARSAEDRFDHLTRLSLTASALPLIIGRDWQIDGPQRLAQWIGLGLLPDDFDALNGGAVFSADDFSLLKRRIADAFNGGRAFTTTISLLDGGRTLHVKGIPADEALGLSGAVLLWIYDASQMQDELGQLRRQRDEAMRSLAALSALIQVAPLPIWLRGRDFDLQLVNQAFVDATGAAAAADVVKSGLELVEPVAGQSARDAARTAAETGQRSIRAIPVTAHGERRMMRVVDVPLGDAGVAGYAIDIQELERVRGEYRRFVDAQRAMMDRMSAAIAQFGPDRQLRFTNQPFRRMFSLEAAWLSENPEFSRLLDRMRETGRIPEVRDYPAWRDERRQWFASNETREEMWLLRDGTHLRCVSQPTPDGGLLLFVEDRTEHVQLEGEKDTLVRVRLATLDNLSEAVGVFQSDGRLQLWNRCFRDVWQLDEAVLVRHPHVDDVIDHIAPLLARPDRAPMIQDVVRAATLDRCERRGTVWFADGRQFDFSATPLPDGNALLTMLDITDSRRIETALRDRADALEAAERLRSAFLANVSYELRTPLTSISGFAEMLAGGYAGPLSDTSRDYVRAIIDSVGLLETQIDSVLDLAQSQAGILPVVRQAVDFAGLVRARVGRMMAAPPMTGVDVAVNIEPEFGIVQGDTKRLAQIVDQLLENSIRYTGRARRSDGRVVVHGDGDDDHVRLIVSDNGPGIAAERIPFLLARPGSGLTRSAFHSDDMRKGVGLPLVRELTEAHGGTVELISEPGVGTMVTIRLPRK